MKSIAIVAAIAGLASAIPQGVSSQLAPSESAPAGCSSDHPEYFMLTVQTLSSGMNKRAVNGSNPLNVTLSKGVLTDSNGRIGGVVANQQFQFDGPPSQTGTIYNAGFSLCSNGSLALGGSAVWYQCLSAPIYNLYDKNIGPQCNAVLLNQVKSSGEAAAMTMSDGQVTAVPATMNVICQIGDGQIQKNTCVTSMTPQTVVSQASDGQPFAPTPAPSSANVPVAPASSAPVPVVQPPSPAANNNTATGTGNTPTAPRNSNVVSTGAASTLNTPAFAFAAGILALFAL